MSILNDFWDDHKKRQEEQKQKDEKLMAHIGEQSAKIATKLGAGLGSTASQVKKTTTTAMIRVQAKMDVVSGKELEEKLMEYTDVYGEVLLALHSRMEDSEKMQRLMMDEIQDLKVTIQELRNELVRAKRSR